MLGALIGVPVATVAYFFLEAVSKAQEYVFTTLPDELGFSSQPAWWSIPFLALSGLLVALSIQYLPGTSGHKPAEGFKASGPVQPIELPGIVIASFATLSLGVVLGPEAPLIAIGSGLAAEAELVREGREDILLRLRDRLEEEVGGRSDGDADQRAEPSRRQIAPTAK